MSLITLMVVAFVIVIIITVVTILAVNRGYAYKHTIDEKPNRRFNEEKND